MNRQSREEQSAQQVLRELAMATTAYHEAPPERLEAARARYLKALERFRANGTEAAPLVMVAGSASVGFE